MSRREHVLRLVLVDSRLSYRALFWWWNVPTFVAVFVISPIFELLFFVYIGRTVNASNDAFYVVGNTVTLTAAACLFGGMMGVSNERSFGTLVSIIGSPAPRIPLFLGRAIPFAINGFVVSLIAFAGGVALVGYRPPLEVIPGLLAVPIAGAASCSALGLVVGAVGLRVRDAWVLPNILWFGMTLIAGANVPPSQLPGWLDALGAVLPLRHAVHAARRVAAGTPFVDVLDDIAIELAIGTALAVVAALMLARFERLARQGAALEQR